MWPILCNVPISPFSKNNCCIRDKYFTNEQKVWFSDRISSSVIHVNNKSFSKRTANLFDHNPPKIKNDVENLQTPSPNQSSSEINNPHITFPSINQEIVEDVATPTENITPTSAIIFSTSTNNNLNTPPKFSDNQIVLLLQNIYSRRMQQKLTRKPADAHKLTHRLLLTEPSLQSPHPYADKIATLPQITEM